MEGSIVRKKFKGSLLVAVLVSVALLTSCTTGDKGTKQTGKTNEEKIETIRVWTGDGSSKELVSKMVEEYNNAVGKDKGIKIEYKVYGGDYEKVLQMACASSETPELFKVPGQLRYYIDNNYIIPIDEMPGAQDFLDKYKGTLRKGQHIFNDKTYAVSRRLTTIGLIYNKDLFKKAGIVDANGQPMPPKTWKEIVEYSKKITKPADKEYGIALPLKWGGYTDFELIYPFMSSVGRTYFDPKTGKYDFTSYKPMLEYLLQIKKDNSYFPGAESLDNDPARAQFAEGRIGMKFAASWDVGVLNDQFPAKIDWGVAEIPLLDANQQRYKQFSIASSYTQISSSAKKANLDKVMEVFKWFSSDEFSQRMYEESKEIPVNFDIAKNAKKQPDKKGWKEFSQMADKSYSNPPPPVIKIDGSDYRQVFLKIWAGAVSIDSGLAELNEKYNQALDKAVADGVIDMSIFKDPAYDISIK